MTRKPALNLVQSMSDWQAAYRALEDDIHDLYRMTELAELAVANNVHDLLPFCVWQLRDQAKALWERWGDILESKAQAV